MEESRCTHIKLESQERGQGERGGRMEGQRKQADRKMCRQAKEKGREEVRGLRRIGMEDET